MKNRNLGVTLIEVVVVTVLASMVMGSAMGIWNFARRNMSRTATRQLLQQDTTRILTYLTADLKAAKSETFASKDNPLTLEITRYCVSPEDNTKLSSEMTQKVKYDFTNPI
jgi:type II secretory pathway component PulJ